MNLTSALSFDAALRGELIRRDGSARALGVLSASRIEKPIGFWHSLYLKLRKEIPFIAGLSFAGFLKWVAGDPHVSAALVTTAGMNYLMTTFVSASNPLTNFKYHDAGTGTTAAAIGDTALQTAWGGARVADTGHTNPTAIQFQSVATIAFNNTFAITEWGLFSASTTGTLWDHRIFSAINVVNGDSIQFTYTVTGTAGGS